jgi:hypothetical protein
LCARLGEHCGKHCEKYNERSKRPACFKATYQYPFLPLRDNLRTGKQLERDKLSRDEDPSYYETGFLVFIESRGLVNKYLGHSVITSRFLYNFRLLHTEIVCLGRSRRMWYVPRRKEYVRKNVRRGG